MSRSYKHYPFCKDNNDSKRGKRYCNKIVRKSEDIPNGGSYKKFSESYDYIYDYFSSTSWRQYQEECHIWHTEPNYRKWYKTYISK